MTDPREEQLDQELALLTGRTGGQTLYGGTTTGEDLILQNNSTDEHGIRIVSGDLEISAGYGKAITLNASQDDTDIIMNGSSAADIFYLDAENSNVGIGYAPTATYKLDINGKTRVAGDVLEIDNFTLNGDTGTISYAGNMTLNPAATVSIGSVILNESGIVTTPNLSSSGILSLNSTTSMNLLIGTTGQISANGAIAVTASSGNMTLNSTLGDINLIAGNGMTLTAAGNDMVLDIQNGYDLIINHLDVANGIMQTDGSGIATSSVTLPDGTLGTTQSAGDGSTKLATTAYADAVSKWTEAAGTLDTVNPTADVRVKGALNVTAIDSETSDILITCGANKTPELQNTVWEDLRVSPGAFQFTGSGDPTLAAWQPGGSGIIFRVYKFQSGDAVYFSVQLPHTYKEGTDLKPHIHWTPGDRGTAESGKTVNWNIYYSWSNIASVFPSSSFVSLSDTCTGTDDLHEITSSGTITGTGKNISSMLTIALLRNTGDTWVGTTVAQSPALLEFDLHYEVNTLGSRQETVK